MAELYEHRLKRLRMRSMRRGIKEMDIILSAFADDHLAEMSDAELLQYDSLLNENDQDLYQWVTGQHSPPDELADLVTRIAVQFQDKIA
ncbi:succinate dehydrogenase assembly factor 2 [Ascidiaceihabitans sp.]|uniref:succinate dehydrogenase assembly factor 2 n=1 Tax=Ascidiaceihabitans sp. TaxID=1872644 RepID=UPI0032982485